MAFKVNIQNKKAQHNFSFIDKYTAGIQLTGTEIKSIKQGKASLVDSFCYFINHELFLKGLNISEYSHGTHFNHEPKRDRKLLLNKKELRKLEQKSKTRGNTIIAYRLFINEKGWAKVQISLAKGKQEFDKREDIKIKDLKRDLDRIRKF